LYRERETQSIISSNARVVRRSKKIERARFSRAKKLSSKRTPEQTVDFQPISVEHVGGEKNDPSVLSGHKTISVRLLFLDVSRVAPRHSPARGLP
jgi:hypothetical protein